MKKNLVEVPMFESAQFNSLEVPMFEAGSITPFELKTEDLILRYFLENPRMVAKIKNGKTVLVGEGEFWADSDGVLDSFKNEILKLSLEYNYNIRYFALLSHLWYHPELVDKVYDEEGMGRNKVVQQTFEYLRDEYLEEAGMKKKVGMRK